MDAMVYRAGFAPTIFAAKQLVNHGHVLVDGKRVDRASCLVKEGQVISINAEKSPKLAEVAKKNNTTVPAYMEVDLDNLKATLVRAPQIEEIPVAVKIMSATMGLLFLQLINHADRLNAQEDEDITVRVLRYIEENYKNGSLTELSEILHYDVSALSREIKNKIGKKYTELVQEKRLSQACFLLKNTDMSIADIAEKTGYENVSFFFRLFKAQHGISPRKYRKS